MTVGWLVGYQSRVLRHPVLVAACAAAVFLAVLPLVPDDSGEYRPVKVWGIALLGVLCYPGLFLLCRARVDYHGTWAQAAWAVVAGIGGSGALLVITVPLSIWGGGWSAVAFGALVDGLPVVLLSAALHGVVLAGVEKAQAEFGPRSKRAPPHLGVWSVATLVAAMTGVFLVLTLGVNLPSPLLAGAATLAVLPHLALMPVPLAAGTVPPDRQAVLTSSDGPRSP